MRNQAPTMTSKMSDAELIALSKRIDELCGELAANFFEGSGDICAASYSLRNVILKRLELVAKNGRSAE
jgi:hypothetical protein